MTTFKAKDGGNADIWFGGYTGSGSSSGDPFLPGLPTGASTAANQSTIITALGTLHTDTTANGVLIGAVNESAAAGDTSSSGLNGLFKRLLQRITTLITAIGSPFQAGGSIGNTAFAATQSGAWTVGVTGTFWQATQPVSNAGTFAVQAVCTNAGTFAVQATLAAETTKVIGTVNVSAGQTIGVTGTFWQATQPVSGTFWQATQPVSIVSSATGGASSQTLVSAASTNKTQIKGSAGKILMITVTNSNAAMRYLKIFNNVSASVTMGTTAADLNFGIPGNTAGAGNNIPIPVEGLDFSTGITIALSTGISLTDNNAVAANEISVNIAYK